MCDKCHELQKAIDEHILSVRNSDKTPDYGYSKRKADANRNGLNAGPGRRWLTPRELAEVLRLEVHKILST